MDFTGTGADENIVGTNGDDTLNGLGGNDTLDGAEGADALYGGDGGDQLIGGEGHDALRGEAGDDTLTGGDGDDYLVGGDGDDQLDGGAGIDRVAYGAATAGVTVDLNLQGVAQVTGQGSDVLTGIEQVSGSGFGDRLTGDGGANWVWGAGGADTLSGGDGDDLLSVGKGDSHVDGGDGVDALSFYSATLDRPVNVSLALQGAAQDTGQGSMTISNIENLSGTMLGGDTLVGDAGDNVIAGWGGSDSLSGGAGDDTLIGDGAIHVDSHGTGGAGPIVVFESDPDAPAGADTLDGGAGNDSLSGGQGDDLLIGGAGSDSLDGGAGDDVAAVSGARADYSVVVQGDGSIKVFDMRSGVPDGVDTLTNVETLRFSDGTLRLVADTISGTSGSDNLVGGLGDDALSGLSGDDTIGGQDGNDTLSGGDGSDFLRGHFGDDSLSGGNGDDFLAGGAGNDTIDGGDGINRVAFGGALNGVTVDLTKQGVAQDTGEGLDVLINIQQVSGTKFDDTLTGDANDNWIWTLGGNDSIDAGDGDDFVQVGKGTVIAAGGAGEDTLGFYSDTLDRPVNVSLALQGAAQDTGDGAMTLSGFENLVGTSIGNDTLIGDGGDNVIGGWGGSDSLVGGAGNDTLLGDGGALIDGIGGAGPVVAFEQDDTAPVGADTLDGGAGDDLLKGGQGDDLLIGGAGADTLEGGEGQDRILMGAGIDVVDGGAGQDGVSFIGGPAVSFDLAVTTAQATSQGMKTIVNVENVGGTAGGDTLAGDAQANWLQGNGGSDSLSGRGGDDVLMVGAGASTVDGGAGADALVMMYETPGGVKISLALQGSAQDTGQGLMTLTSIENLSGTIYGDTLSGDSGANFLGGEQGSDSLVGGAGDDVLIGDGEITVINGVIQTVSAPAAGAPAGVLGDDTLIGGAGNDWLDGGGGNDTAVFSGAQADYAVAVQGDGRIVVTDLRAGGPDGVDTLTSIENLKFSDGTISVGAGGALSGSAGNDSFDGTPGADTYAGLAGDDTIGGLADNDSLSGGDGNDFIRGGAGDDTLSGGDGDDFLAGMAGNDVIDGGAGINRAVYGAASHGVTVDLTKQGQIQDTGDGQDVLTNIQQVSGTDFADTLTGDGNDNWIWSVSGNDLIDAGAGNDLVDVGKGTVIANGGAGVDTLGFYSATLDHAVSVSLALQGAAQDTGDGSMTLSGFENLVGTFLGNDTLSGDDGDNLLAGWGGSDLLVGGGGNDTLLGDGTVFPDGSGGAGPITVFIEDDTGPQGADTLDGGAGDDYLRGGQGDDRLIGGAGDDVLGGGLGNDTAMFSGARTDYTVALQGDGSVIVTDLRAGSPDGTDHLANIEFLKFSDGTIAVDAASAASGTAGNDTLSGTAGADTYAGLAGDDNLAGQAGNDSLDGGAGDDTLAAGAGDDTVNGGDGQDLLFVGLGNDVIDGGAGQDRLSFVGGQPVKVDLSLTTAQVTGQGTKTIVNVEHLLGTTGGDTLAGDAQANLLFGGGGADSLSGRGGDDVLMLGAGASTVDGGAGSDALVMTYATAGGLKISLALQGVAQDTGQGQMKLTGIENLSGTIFGDVLTGDGGANVLAGEKGADSLVGGDGDDTLLGDGEITVEGGAVQMLTSPSDAVPAGAAGPDTLDGGAGNDSLNGGDGDDLLIGGTGQDTLDGGAGFDTANFTTSTAWVDVELPFGTVAVNGVAEDQITNVEAVVGSNFWDKIVGDGADNRLSGLAGHDFLQGGGGNDTLLGGADDDFLSGGAGDDVLDGGAGIDRAAFSSGATGGVTVDLNLQGGVQNTGQGNDLLTGIEHLSGTRFSDKLTGDGGANWLWGGSDGSGVTGNDTISAGGGDDLVQVGTGDHNLDGGAGIDTLSFQGNGSDITSAGVIASLAAQGSAQATNQGSMTFTGFENLSGSKYGDTLTGDAGANVLAGYDGSDSLVGGAGDDVLLGDSLIHVDTHGVGTSGSITTFNDMGTGDDTLDGGAGNDLIKGEAGNDKLFSGTGNDTLDGGAGADTLTAQAGGNEVTKVTLGAGADKLVLDAALGGKVVATDFQTGVSGDVIDFSAYLAGTSSWNGTDNPFVAGYLQLVQDGTSTLLQINPDAAGADFTTLVTFQNTSSLLFTAANLGFAPLPRVVGGTSGDTFTLDLATFTPGTPGHSLEVDGGQGTDVVNVVAPTLVGANSTITASPDGTALLMDLDGDGVTDLTITNVEDIVVNGQRVVISGDLSATGLAPHTIHYMGGATDDLLDASGLTSVEAVDAHGLAGNDTLIGAGGDDNLEGDDGDDKLVGAGGPDVFVGGAGNDTIDGGSGASVDVAVFSGHHGDYTVTDLGGGVLTIAGPDGTDRLIDIERLQFDDGLYGPNHAPAGADRSASVGVGSTKVFAVTDFGFTDPDGDSLGGVKITSLPGAGTLKDNGVLVTAGQLVSAADIAAGHLVFAPGGAGSTSFTFQVEDDGVVGWGVNLDASANTFTVTATEAPPPSPPPPPAPLPDQGTEGDDVAILPAGGAHFLAGGGNDQVTGGTGGDFLQGNAGDDTLDGGAGDDTLAGGRDQDLLSGGVGDDWLSGDAGNDTLDGGAGADTVFGGDGDDQIRGGAGDNYLRGGAGQDVISGGSGFDYINGNEGNDTASGGLGDDWVLGGKDDDALSGDEGNDILYGNMGADSLDGGVGADLLRGGQGDDLLRGGDGDDWLSGDRGDDTLTGGAGADTFHTFHQAGVDRVTDFNAGEGDRVLVDAGTHYTVTQVGADTVIDMGDGDRMILQGVELASLPAGWILAG